MRDDRSGLLQVVIMFSRFVVHPGAGHLVNAISGSGLMVPVRVDIESPSRFVGALKLLRLWVMRARERRALVRLDEHALTDIGMSRADALSEAAKPFWRR